MQIIWNRKVIFIILVILTASIWKAPVRAEGLKVLVVRLSGTVLLKSSNGKWEPARNWMNLPKDSYLKALQGSSLDLMINKGAIIRIKGESEFSLGQVLKKIKKAFDKAKPGYCSRNRCSKGTLLKLMKGKAFFYITPDFSGLPFIVDTPLGIAGVTGTRFAVEISKDGQLIVAVYQGQVVVWQKRMVKKIVVVTPGNITKVQAGKPPLTPFAMTDAQRKRYEECLKLHFGLEKNQAGIETSGRYRGVFSRGYSPETLSEFGPTRTYQHEYQNSAIPNEGEHTGKQVHETKNSSSSPKTVDGPINHHSTRSDHHSKKEHKDVMDKHKVKDHSMKEKRTRTTTPHSSRPAASMVPPHTTAHKNKHIKPTSSGTGHKR